MSDHTGETRKKKFALSISIDLEENTERKKVHHKGTEDTEKRVEKQVEKNCL